jgi:polyphosphate kinase 2 (PPK2 family)
MSKKSVNLDKVKPLKPFKDKEAYADALDAVQKRLLAVQQAYLLQQRRAVVVFEGTDAAGKGGTIRRLTARLDPRFCKVWPTGAPSDLERKEHYLQRFWPRLPEGGTIAVFDRSWYGRVLVERAEKLIPKRDWKRAYGEINEFERLQTDDGTRLVKIYLHIGPQTQKRRFVERLTDPVKRWKITRRDFEARQYQDAYREAAAAMLALTDTKHAPWHLLDGEYKWAAQVRALTIIADALSDDVNLDPPPLDAALKQLARDALGVDL